MEYIRQGDAVGVSQEYIRKLVVSALSAALLEDRPYMVEQNAADMLYVFGDWDASLAAMNAMVKGFGYEFAFAKDNILRDGKQVSVIYLSLVSLDEGNPDEGSV